MTKIAIVGTVGLPACYGGWETLVDNMVKSNASDLDYSVYCSSTSYKKRMESYNGAKLIYLPISANGISSIFYDIASMIHTLFTKPKVIVILGVSGCVFLPLFKLLSHSKLIVNVDGIEWKRDKWSGFAKKFLKFSEAMAIRYADVVVADNDGIRDYIKSEYGKKSEVIAYGGEHALVSNTDSNNSDYFFTVCRIEPENNVEMILEAFSNSDVNYKIIGNWGASLYGEQLKAKFSVYDNIEIIDPVYDLNILFEYRNNCKGYIHGHSVGGTNPSLVEIMHFSKQVYAFDCVYNRFTTEDEALYFSTSDDLKGLVTNQSLSANNDKMKEIAMRRYTWEIVAKQYESLYGGI
jgi:glycosyltransferase involved in cell wall biosynthesis